VAFAVSKNTGGVAMLRKIILLGMISLFLSGCTSYSSSTVVKQRAPISFHHYFSGELSGGIDDMVQEYNLSQELYQLNVVPIDHEAYKLSIIKSFEDKNPTDMNSYWAGAKTSAIVEYLEPLDDVFLENQFETLFDPNFLKSVCEYEGHYYLLPITQHYITFFYNKEVFERLKIQEPTTWNEFLEVCRIMKKNDITPIGLGAKDKWPAQFWFDYLLLRTAGNEYRDNLLKGQNKFTDTQVVTVMEMWKNLVDLGYFNENATQLDWGEPIVESIIQGEFGMTLNGTWLFCSFKEQSAMDKIGVFSFPVINSQVQSYSLGPIDGIIVGSDALNKLGAKEAIIEFAQVDAQTKMAIGSGGFAPNVQVSMDIYHPLQIELLEDIRTNTGWAFNFDLAADRELSTAGLNMFADFMNYPSAYKTLLEELESIAKNK